MRTPAAPAVEPEAQHVLVLAADVGVLPVQVGLARREQVEVPLARGAVGVLGARPGDVAEVRRPAVGRQAAVRAASGAEPEAVPERRSGAGGQGRLEPRVLVRHVVGDDVDDRADAEVEWRRG